MSTAAVECRKDAARPDMVTSTGRLLRRELSRTKAKSRLSNIGVLGDKVAEEPVLLEDVVPAIGGAEMLMSSGRRSFRAMSYHVTRLSSSDGRFHSCLSSLRVEDMPFFLRNSSTT